MTIDVPLTWLSIWVYFHSLVSDLIKLLLFYRHFITLRCYCRWDEKSLHCHSKWYRMRKLHEIKKNKTTYKQSIHIWQKNNYHSSSIFKVDFQFFMARYFIPGYKISNTFINDYWSIYLLLLLFAIHFFCLFMHCFCSFVKIVYSHL